MFYTTKNPDRLAATYIIKVEIDTSMHILQHKHIYQVLILHVIDTILTTKKYNLNLLVAIITIMYKK